MTNGLDAPVVKWLTYLVYILLTVLTILTGWHTVTLSKLPDNFVRLERYQSDNARIEQGVRDINNKLDRLIEKKSGDHYGPQRP